MEKTTLEALLLAKEKRVSRQKQWLERHRGYALLSLTLVTPGMVKESPTSYYIMSVALNTLLTLFFDRHWVCIEHQVWWFHTGAEAFFIVAHKSTQNEVHKIISVTELKKVLVECEESHVLGRLWDMDVITQDPNSHHYRPISRNDLGLEPRQCFICHRSAKACARSRKHSLLELQQYIEKTVNEYANIAGF